MSYARYVVVIIAEHKDFAKFVDEHNVTSACNLQMLLITLNCFGHFLFSFLFFRLFFRQSIMLPGLLF